MRIAKIESFFLRCPFPEGVRYVYSGGGVENMDVCLIRVTDEDGAFGIGEVTHGQFCYEPIVGLVAHFSRILKGHPAADINRAWDLMYQSSLFWNRQGIGIGVMGGIDIALHDLLGKQLQVPVYQLLGGAARSSVRIYASNGLFGDADSMIADIRRAKAANFTAYKMRVVDPDTIVSLVEAARRDVGGAMDLIVDAVQGSCAVPWSLTISQRLAAALESSRVLWLEEPCRVEDVGRIRFPASDDIAQHCRRGEHSDGLGFQGLSREAGLRHPAIRHRDIWVQRGPQNCGLGRCLFEAGCCSLLGKRRQHDGGPSFRDGDIQLRDDRILLHGPFVERQAYAKAPAREEWTYRGAHRARPRRYIR